MAIFPRLFLPFLLPSVSFAAFTWKFTSTPHQCQDLSVSVSGSGQPPYSLLIIPSGPTILPNAIEARTIQQHDFDGDSTTLTFKLNYPADSGFVAVVSDKSGFGSGGTTLPATVLNSTDASCFNSTTSVSAPWVFSINPIGGLTECQATRFYWRNDLTNGTVRFVGIIPGGQSFEIPVTGVTNDASTGTGFSWTPDVRAGTSMLVAAGDDRGLGKGGSASYIINTGTNESCIVSDSPSSTPGSPAGGSYPTSTDGSLVGGGNANDTGSSNVGAIVGGVVGGVGGLLIILLVALFYLRRRRFTKATKTRPVNILQDDEDDRHHQGELPEYYEPEPFLVPDPSVATSDGASTHDGQTLMSEHMSRPITPGQRSMTEMSTTTRKSGMPRSLRPVNIVQHEDAGPSVPQGAEEPETVELPPAYTHIRTANSTPQAENPPQVPPTGA
ncbi:hypothetical protein OF83DRAFT_1067664 [Amylostereum chailletii]|nr:hypothetical protein OF83DRAFT_1067664 [Amylostereum chailletii]